MKKKNGFTVVELIASFALTMIISVFLFEVLIEVKDVYVETAIKTNIQEKTALISKNIKAIMPEIGGTITCQSNSCNIDGKFLTITHINNIKEPDYVTINDQRFYMPKDGDNYVKISDIKLSATEGVSDGYLKIHFKLTSDNLNKDYNYTAVYYYTR